jgi:hypothetical protein
VKTLIEKDKLGYSELAKKEPLVTEQDFNEFKSKCESIVGKAKSQRGKQLRDMNIGTHHLGSGGYKVAVPKWEKEDAEAIARGETPPFHDITDPQAHYFVRARFPKPKGSSSYSLEPAGPTAGKVKDFMEKYVSN